MRLTTILAALDPGVSPVTALRREADRLAALDSPSTAAVEVTAQTARTRAAIMAEAATSIVAQATFSRNNVRDLLAYVPAGGGVAPPD